LPSGSLGRVISSQMVGELQAAWHQGCRGWRVVHCLTIA
jgi:hypothetical protein